MQSGDPEELAEAALAHLRRQHDGREDVVFSNSRASQIARELGVDRDVLHPALEHLVARGLVRFVSRRSETAEEVDDWVVLTSVGRGT